MSEPKILSAIGRTYPPTPPYHVGREHIRTFARAIGENSPVYRDFAAARALGYPDVVAPPTFPVVFTQDATEQVTGDAELGIDFSRLVHGAQRFVYRRPIHAGDALSCVVEVADVKLLAGNLSITLCTKVADVDGDAVLTEWSTLVVRAPEA